MDIGTIIHWAFSNILWEALSTIFVVLSFIFLKVIPISVKLLRKNRDTRGNGYGTHFADRFVDIWCSSGLLQSNKKLYTFPNNRNSRYIIEVIDKNLHELGLIEKDTSKDKDYDVVKPVRNWKNKTIFFIIETWLVYVMGDNKNFYKGLKRE